MMIIFLASVTCLILSTIPPGIALPYQDQNTTFVNPILPGFYPDPSCIFVEEFDQTFFCASSSFNAFPGIPIHASKDLQNWKLVSNVLNRKEQLPQLAITNGSTSGIWAPTIRYHDGTFYLVTTLVHDKNPADDPHRWENIVFKSKDPYQSASWSTPVYFDFVGYDPSPFWHDNGKVYMTGGHAWRVSPGIYQTTIDLDTGKQDGPFVSVWNGTGGLAPEGPHIYKKDGYYYLMAAEGGTDVNHMETIARARDISGPYESNPKNPIVTNANTTVYFQTVGHADLFQDASSNWWGVALSTRSGPEWKVFPMGRETILSPVTWKEGEWPIWSRINGTMSGWAMPPVDKDIPGTGPFVDSGDNIDFAPESDIPAHFLFWRFPIEDSYTISPPGHPYTLRLKPSKLNLTSYDGNYAGPEGQTFIGRRQSHSLFRFQVTLDYSPKVQEEEAGVSVFLTMNHHADLGVVLLPSNSSGNAILEPHFRFRAVSYVPVPDEVIVPVPKEWRHGKLVMEVKAMNASHYALSAGPAKDRERLQVIAYVPALIVSWGFTGVLLGAYATSNGGNGTTPAYLSEWKYFDLHQIRA